MSEPTPTKGRQERSSAAVRNTRVMQYLFLLGAVLGVVGVAAFGSGTSKFSISLAALILFTSLALGMWVVLKPASLNESDRRIQDDEADALLQAAQWTVPPELAADHLRPQFSILQSEHAKATGILALVIMWAFFMAEVTSPPVERDYVLLRWSGAAALIVLIGSFMMAEAFRLARLFRVGKTAPAVIVEMQRLGKHKQSLKVVVRFRVEGGVYEARSQFLKKPSSYTLGGIVTVLFNPARPSDVVIFEPLQE